MRCVFHSLRRVRSAAVARTVRRAPEEQDAWGTLSTNSGSQVVTRVLSLSKSSYISSDQCHLRLCHDTYARDLAFESDDTLKAVFATGHEVGEMASRCYPGGHFVAHDNRHSADALAETLQLIESGSVSALF